MSDVIHVDKATEVVLSNWWLEVEDIVGYIEDRASKDPKFAKKLKEELTKLNLDELIMKAFCYVLLEKKGKYV